MKPISLIIPIVAVVVAIAAGALFFVTKGKLSEQVQATQSAQQAIQAVQAELATANQENSTLSSQLEKERNSQTEQRRTVENLRSEVSAARQEVTRAQAELTKTKQTVSELESTAKNLRTDLLAAEETIASKNNDAKLAQLNNRVAELEKTNADLKETLETAKAEAEKAAAIAKNAAARNSGSLLTGGIYSSQFRPTSSQPLPNVSIGPATTIQEISSRDGFVVLGNSPEIGLALGSTVKLVSDMEAIGSVRIVQLKDNLAIANILPGSKTQRMQAGSSVTIMR